MYAPVLALVDKATSLAGQAQPGAPAGGGDGSGSGAASEASGGGGSLARVSNSAGSFSASAGAAASSLGSLIGVRPASAAPSAAAAVRDQTFLKQFVEDFITDTFLPQVRGGARGCCAAAALHCITLLPGLCL